MGSGETAEASGNGLAARAKPLCSKGMEEFSTHLKDIMVQLSAYPRWLVASCGIIVALAVLWVLGKLLKLTLQVILALAGIALIGGAVWWALGYF